MNLIQKIKQILGFNKTKRLEAAKETNTNQTKKTISKENILVDLNKETVEATKSEKIKEILKAAGCKKEIFLRVDKFENIDTENLRQVLILLTNLNLTKYELNVVLGQNIDLLYIQIDEINHNVNMLRAYLKDENILKNIIYTNPFVLTEDVENKVAIIKNIFSDMGLTLKEQAYILDENSNVLSLGEQLLNESMNFLKQVCKTKTKTKQLLIAEPGVIGITDANTLKQFIE